MIAFDKSKIDCISLPKWAAERLLQAPPACFKLYVYGLLRSKAEDTEQISAETGLSMREVMDAMDALRTLELFVPAEGASAFCYAADPPQTAFFAPEVYDDAEYNAMLQALFSDRVLSMQDYKTFYECRDVYGLPAKVVLLLAEYCILNHRAKNQLPMSFIREEGRKWANEHIVTVEQADEKIATERSVEAGVREVLRRLGIRKSPSEEEQKLYLKWTRDWGFSLGGIRAAMVATTKAQYPSMKYLDSILKELYQAGKFTAAEVTEHFTAAEEMDENVKALLSRLGAPRHTVTADMRQMYARWQTMGFSQKEVLFAASMAVQKGSANLEYVNMLLTGWRMNGLATCEQIEDHLKRDGLKRQSANRMLSLAGVPREATRRDIETYERFLRKYGLPADVVLYAAECAYGMNTPLKAMEKILQNWQTAGVKDLKSAREENRRHRQKSRKLQDFSERSYTSEDIRARIEDPLADILREMEGQNDAE